MSAKDDDHAHRQKMIRLKAQRDRLMTHKQGEKGVEF